MIPRSGPVTNARAHFWPPPISATLNSRTTTMNSKPMGNGMTGLACKPRLGSSLNLLHSFYPVDEPDKPVNRVFHEDPIATTASSTESCNDDFGLDRLLDLIDSTPRRDEGPPKRVSSITAMDYRQYNKRPRWSTDEEDPDGSRHSQTYDLDASHHSQALADLLQGKRSYSSNNYSVYKHY